jgi:penicillin-binding protein 1A
MLRGALGLPRRAWRRLRRLSWKQWLLLATGSVASLVFVLVLAFAIAYATVQLPDDPEQAATSFIYDAKGNVLTELYDDQNRVEVRLDQVSAVMQHAVLAAEDRNFYSHPGIDPVGLTRALLNNIRGGPIEGGSTITQQLAKNLYLGSERSVTRKVREAVLAVKIEREHSKDEILERYLNTIYFGRGAHGVEQAAHLYFGKTAADLDLSESAFLAGMIRRPERAEPSTHIFVALGVRKVVLDAMVRTGVIDRATAQQAEAKALDAIAPPDPEAGLSGSSAFFVAEVRKWAQQQFGEQAAFSGGLRIETTLDPDLQAAAERAVLGVLDRPDDPDAALVAMNADGAIVAMIGGKDFQRSKVNLAIGKDGGGLGRGAGSTFKPIVLAAALRAGVPITSVFDGPSELEVPFAGNPDYLVHNYGDREFGIIDLLTATKSSVNTVYAQLAAQIGIETVVQTAEDLGITTPLKAYPSLTLGAQEVSVLEMTRAYMTFANRGNRPDPYYVSRVTDTHGNVLYEAKPRTRKVYPTDDADLVNYALQGVIQAGTGTAANIGRPAAGKTGTTEENTDAWFAGYTPQIGAVVWMGYKEDTREKMTNVHGITVTGGTLPARIWQRFMEEATANLPPLAFEDPPSSLLEPAEPIIDEPDPIELTTTTSAPSSTTTASTGSTSTTGSTSSTSTSTTTPLATTSTSH